MNALQNDNTRNRIYRTEAIVLSRLDFKEADRIVTIYTPDHGRIKVIVKGARRPTSQLGPHFELFSRVVLGLAKGRDIDTVTAAEAVESRPRLRTDLQAYASASHLVEVLNCLAADHQANRSAYQQFARSMRNLGEGSEARLVCRHFELAALTLFGFKPELYLCVNCRNELQAEENYISGDAGGMLCPSCRKVDPRAPLVSVNGQKVLRTLERSGFAGGQQLQITSELHEEVQRVLLAYLRVISDRDLKSLKVLEDLGV